MVTVEAAPLAVGVTGLVPVTLQAGAGEPPPVTAQVNWTGEAYAAIDVSVTVEVLVAPGETAAGAVAVMLKSGTDTVSVSEVDWAADGPVPVTVIVYAPRVVVLVVPTVSADVPAPPVTADGTKRQEGIDVAPAGPETVQVRATLPLNAFSEAIVIVEVAELPAASEAGLNGVAAREKAGCPYLTTNASITPPL